MTLTEKNRANLNMLVCMLRKGSVTKQCVMDTFGVGERVARDMLSEIAKRCPLISLSDATGYRIAMHPQDVGDAMHAYNENRKRSEEILKRNEPLEKFLEENRA